MLRGGLLIIHPLPNVAGSAADRSTFFLLNGVVGDPLFLEVSSRTSSSPNAGWTELNTDDACFASFFRH